MNEQLIQALEAIKVSIAYPEMWAKIADARNSGGEPCEATDPDAVAWSLAGAIKKHAATDEAGASAALAALSTLLPPHLNSVEAYNDGVATHRSVLNLVDEAIYNAKRVERPQ